jgi:hypothetical protein
VIFGWLLLAPVPASITTGVPHAVRTLNFLPTWQILSALGLVTAIVSLSNIKLKILNVKILYIVGLICFMLAVFNFSYYLNQYFVQQNYYSSQFWQYGYAQAVDEVKKMQNSYKEIVISDDPPLDKSYMFFLFYLKYPPAEYQRVGANSSGSFVSHHSFGRYTFRPIDWKTDSLQKGVLYVGSPEEIPQGAGTKTIYNFDGSPAIVIAGT